MNVLHRGRWSILPLVLSVAGLTGCNGSGPDPATDSASPATASGQGAVTADEAGRSAEAPAGFDIEAVPESDVALGDFPYFKLPAGYGQLRKPGPIVELARAPVWTGGGLEWVEGRVYMEMFTNEKGKAFSALELERNISHLVEQAGGVKVASGLMPREIRDQIPDDVSMAFLDGLGPISDYPTYTWLVRRADRSIWVHMSAHTSSGAWFVVESAPFVATATLLPASHLQSTLDEDGRVAIEVNFATDRSEILPDSQPQIAEVVDLMEAAPALRLGVDGHTDNTGAPARNQALSEARAEAVVSAVAARGIDAARLVAQGHGDSRPLDDNGTEAGKARNRRVELVKL